MIIFLGIALTCAIASLLLMADVKECGKGTCVCRSDEERETCKEWNK